VSITFSREIPLFPHSTFPPAPSPFPCRLEWNSGICPDVLNQKNENALECRKVEEEEEVDSGEEEDEFYDRTTKGGAKKQKVAPLVHDAASLFGRKVHFTSIEP